jgi:hypothetical protein
MYVDVATGTGELMTIKLCHGIERRRIFKEISENVCGCGLERQLSNSDVEYPQLACVQVYISIPQRKMGQNQCFSLLYYKLFGDQVSAYIAIIRP